jgi:hypothetical protein
MIKIEEITSIDKKTIAIMDTSSISFLQVLHNKGIIVEEILKDYELILVPQWVLNEIGDAAGRADYMQSLIKQGYPIYCIAEDTYSELTGYEEGNLYEIVLASTSLLGRVRAYLRKFVERSDVLDQEEYGEWINKLYDEWPIPGETLSSGRVKKKNAGEVSITILAEVISWYRSDTEVLTIYTQDRDTYEFQHEAEKTLRELFSERTPVQVSFKSNDAIFCQLFRSGKIGIDDILECRKDQRRVTYSKELADQSVSMACGVFDNDSFVNLIQNENVLIIF